MKTKKAYGPFALDNFTQGPPKSMAGNYLLNTLILMALTGGGTSLGSKLLFGNMPRVAREKSKYDIDADILDPRLLQQLLSEDNMIDTTGEEVPEEEDLLNLLKAGSF